MQGVQEDFSGYTLQPSGQRLQPAAKGHSNCVALSTSWYACRHPYVGTGATSLSALQALPASKGSCTYLCD